ncbi:MAG: hypothetical protein A2309_08845 [Bacteroidetes bacterium RIFOXYB2_FULL_35_7]|nr:MAG: hypothetical protein A2X01_09865 [Bacteroidetes bacterium GWF2_35_48]OFY94457.1 MAG: hypothetical protein A2309_08845 [Bacteroidetes bacterium RIFOXYB2_FULL_35_7]OFY97923.1 MAG: hypothetical protein A2491_18220 [Bacteroidetes bacterium RIFOXYC12_FULL_35_7]HBX51623.1 hypothetical protein [Bacteroidales bacterium]
MKIEKRNKKIIWELSTSIALSVICYIFVKQNFTAKIEPKFNVDTENTSSKPTFFIAYIKSIRRFIYKAMKI